MENYINYLRQRVSFYEQVLASVTNLAPRVIGRDAQERMTQLGTVYGKVDRLLNVYHDLLKYAEQPVEQFIRTNKLYGPFKEIFESVADGPLSIRDKIDVVKHFVNINMSVLGACSKDNEFEKSHVIDLEKLGDFSFQSVTEAELRQMFDSGEIVLMTEKDEKLLTEREKNILSELTRFYQSFPLTFEGQWDLFNKFKTHYIDKEASFDLDDIAEIIAFFEQIEIPDEDLSDIHRYLLKDYYRRQAKVLKKHQQSTPREVVNENIKVTLKERKTYKEIIREIKSYYDNGEFTHPLTRRELYYLLSLMLDVEMPMDSLTKVIEKWYNEQQRYNIFTEYLSNYERYAYYASKQHYETDLSFLDELFGSIFITTDDDYEATKQYMLEECTRMDTLINSKYCYDYEIAQAHKLLNKKGN